MQRPLGVTILAILSAIGGVLILCVSLAALGIGGALGGLLGREVGPFAGAVVGGLASVIGFISLAIAILALAFAYGAWTLQPWAWVLGVFVWGASLVLGVIGLLNGGSTSEIIRLVLAGAILYYLNTPEVKQAFGRPGLPPPDRRDELPPAS
jgi:hypothetical protein